jgi:hypothetical protein
VRRAAPTRRREPAVHPTLCPLLPGTPATECRHLLTILRVMSAVSQGRARSPARATRAARPGITPAGHRRDTARGATARHHDGQAEEQAAPPAPEWMISAREVPSQPLPSLSNIRQVADWRLSDRGIHSLSVIVTVTFFVTVSGQILRPPTTGRIRADPQRTAAAGPGDAVHRHVGRDRFRAAGRLGPRPPSGAGGEDAEQRRVPDAAGSGHAPARRDQP